MDVIPDADKLAFLRKVYSAQILATAQVRNRRLEQAFAAVPREKFMPAGRWTLAGQRGEIPLPDNNPALLYQDALFALKPSKGINNGEPSLHARMLSHLNVQPGDRIVHVGAGTGYYSAILAELAGPQGQVTAVEFDAELAEMAAANLKDRSNVGVVHDDGARHPQAEAERIYVNFAVERPAQRWIDGLSSNGRLVFPLAAPAESASPEQAEIFRSGRRLPDREVAGRLCGPLDLPRILRLRRGRTGAGHARPGGPARSVCQGRRQVGEEPDLETAGRSRQMLVLVAAMGAVV